MTFNERLALSRSEDNAQKEKQQRISNIRSSAFTVGKEEMEEYKTKAADIPEQPYKPREYTRNEVLSGTGARAGGHLSMSSTAPSQGASALPGDGSGGESAATDSEASFESYSGLHLSKRILPHKVLTRAIRGMKTYLIKDLLRHVKAPNWSLPDVESDIVVFAIIASKSEPRNHRPGPGGDGKSQKDRGKYMVVRLVDLSFELELYLFNAGFDRFWKLAPGTVLAILNPTIMPPPSGREATGKFGLVINNDADTILEIGNARDIGYCKSVKKDGSLCSSWINIRRTEYCEYHTNEAIKKTRAGRMELNNTRSFGSGRDGSHSKHNEVFGEKKRPEEEFKRGAYDRFNHTAYFVNSSHRHTAQEERENSLAERHEREEGLKRKLQRQERERDIAKRLGEIGGGAGKEYMSHAATTTKAKPTTASTLGSSVNSSSSTTSAKDNSFSSRLANTSLSTTSATTADKPPPPRWDARALGLVGKRGDDVPKISLGPVKRKRPESSASSSTAGEGSFSNGKPALGWGSALSSKLTQMRNGERLDGRQITDFFGAAGGENEAVSNGVVASGTAAVASSSRGDRSPVRKKTRFVTEKGIREAGRESLGEGLAVVGRTGRVGREVVMDDDDDDDLIIVK
jgi:minichromosome maintenance protein 10